MIYIFFLIQFIMPFRHYFIPGNTDWTGDAQHFSSRIKIYIQKVEEFKFAVFNLDNKIINPIDMETYLLEDLINQMYWTPTEFFNLHFIWVNSAKRNSIAIIWR